jgi:cobalt-zinc-cadmium efflux system protein
MSDSHYHSHEHGHHHAHAEDGIHGIPLILTILLNLIITAAEVIGGILSNSLALLSDALHNFSDGLSVLLAYFAFRISRKKSDYRKTYGYKRAEILAALLNSSALVVICMYLFYEAVNRFLHPEPVSGNLMLIIALIGLLGNLTSVLILRKGKGVNINIKAAYLHLLGDTLSSVAVIIGALLIIYFRIYWLDPILTFVIGLYILKEAYSIISETVEILMQAVPPGIDLELVSRRLSEIGEISNVHHVHVWQLDDKSINLECHIELSRDMQISNSKTIISEVQEILHQEFNIGHSTLQIEYGSNHLSELVATDKGCC